MKKYISIGLLVILFLTGSCNNKEVLQKETSVSVEIPSYVVPIVIRGENYKGLANAFLIDREERLFVTNAHVIAAGQDPMIKLDNTWYSVEANSDWINWHADLAILRLWDKNIYSDAYSGELPDAALLGKTFSIGTPVAAAAYIIDYNERKLKLHAMKVRIRSLDSAVWGGILEYLMTLKINGSIPKEDLSKFYQHYIEVERDGELEKFCEGMSGGPLYTDDGKVVGIMAAANNSGNLALCVPASEIKALLEKVKMKKKKTAYELFKKNNKS